MDAERHARTHFVVVNLAWTAAVVTIAAIAAGLAIAYIDWSGVRLLGIIGLVAGTTIGVVRDRRVSQGLLGLTGVVLLAFALSWASGNPPPANDQVLVLLGAAAFAFLTSHTLTRIWGREHPVVELTPEVLDEAVAHPHTG